MANMYLTLLLLNLLSANLIYYNKLFQSAIFPAKLAFLPQCIFICCGTNMLLNLKWSRAAL